MPNDLARLDAASFIGLPLELPIALLLLACLPGRAARPVRAVLAVTLSLVMIIKLADMAAFQAFARPFNPILDFHLLDAAWNLTSGAIGTAGAVGVLVAIALAIVAILAASVASLTVLDRAMQRHRGTAIALIAAVLCVALFAPTIATRLDQPEMASAVQRAASFGSTRLMSIHAGAVSASLRDLEAFRAEAAIDPAENLDDSVLLNGLAGKDVLMIFVESYGRTVIDNPAYAPSVLPVLDEFEAALERRNFSSASGFMTAPIVGGQSWLAHASVLSGLWVDNQRRFNSMIVSNRATLVDDFNRAGWRTAAVMPAITLAWPEGEFFGYDAIHDWRGLNYRGEPFNWVTMPDQYTLSAFDRLERSTRQRPPLFAEIALISSHAPWTPIPEIIDWDAVGDGSIFNEQAASGDPPNVVWADPDRVRTQFRLSIEYALANLASYAEERLDGDFVMIVLGDHQPARIITGETTNRDVPFHVISNDPAVTAAVVEEWGLAPGMHPDAGFDPWPMNAFRQRLIETFSAAPAAEDLSTMLESHF
jgi:hypothetical protein